MGELWAEIAVPVPVRRLLTYRVPPALRDRVQPGVRAMVTVGPRRMTGVVISVVPATEPPPARLRDVTDILDDKPLLSRELLSFVLGGCGKMEQFPLPVGFGGPWVRVQGLNVQ